MPRIAAVLASCLISCSAFATSVTTDYTDLWWIPTESGWGATAGDVGHSGSPEDRRGQRIDVRDGVVRCLYCHVTRSRNFRDLPPAGGPGPEAADRAIGCERCHGPGGNHIRAINQDLQDLEGSSDFAIVRKCATCSAGLLPSRK